MKKKVKICGLTPSENMHQIAALKPHYLGMIFYSKSPRFVADFPKEKLPNTLPLVGVFVNDSLENILENANQYQLTVVQLHGKESANLCQKLTQKGITVWKAFSVTPDFDFELLNEYAPHCEAFLFDTPSPNYGGSGMQFDWEILNQYRGKTPFWLSGGLGLENIDLLIQWHHPQLIGYDFNSKLETKPGIKSVYETQKIIQKINKL